MKGVSYDNPLMIQTRLDDLLPDHNYRITIYAKNGQGRGKGYTIEDRTLPDGREYQYPLAEYYRHNFWI